MTDEEQELSGSTATDPNRLSTWSPVPSWLRVPPSARGLPAPIRTRLQLLPVGDLAWEDFERLCVRLLDLDGESVHMPEVTGLYGRRGQAQSGIDVYARDRFVPGKKSPQRRYVALQARRIKTVTKAGLSGSVDSFLEGGWAHASRKFICATSASTRSTKLVDEIEALADRLSRQAIEFSVWDQEEISRRLKDLPEIVDDFFGRQWVKEFCGHPAAQTLGTRLDARQVADLRRELARIYMASFSVADSGLIAFRFNETRKVGLMERFVTPDLISTTPQTAAQPQPVGSPAELGVDDYDPAGTSDGGSGNERSSVRRGRMGSPQLHAEATSPQIVMRYRTVGLLISG